MHSTLMKYRALMQFLKKHWIRTATKHLLKGDYKTHCFHAKNKAGKLVTEATKKKFSNLIKTDHINRHVQII